MKQSNELQLSYCKDYDKFHLGLLSENSGSGLTCNLTIQFANREGTLQPPDNIEDGG
jgi:hypothetical protein